MAKLPYAPGHLSPRAKQLYRQLAEDYAIVDAAGLELLRRVGEASDRADQAAKIVQAEGVTVMTRHGEVRVHPAVAVERDARRAVAQLLADLKLDPEGAQPRREAPKRRQ